MSGGSDEASPSKLKTHVPADHLDNDDGSGASLGFLMVGFVRGKYHDFLVLLLRNYATMTIDTH